MLFGFYEILNFALEGQKWTSEDGKESNVQTQLIKSTLSKKSFVMKKLSLKV